MVNPESVIVYNPRFGKCETALGEVDDCIFIDGVLWDFKTNKTCESQWIDETEAWQYYVYDSVAKLIKDNSESLFKLKINALAFYKARFAEIEYLKTKDINKKCLCLVMQNTIKTINNMKYEDSIDDAFIKSKNEMLYKDF